MPFHRRRFPPGLTSTKNISETSGILAAGASTVLTNVVAAVDAATLADPNGVQKNSKVNAMYFSLFFISEGGEVANEVPLVDWYIIKNPGNSFGSTFDATNLPTPGATGVHVNKRYIIHTEKGLVGGGDASLAGVPMIFKGVIMIPRGMRTMRANDQMTVCARANFATKFCVQAIYKWFI